MKQLAVISGKGGAGKTCLSACIFQLARRDGFSPICVDADVDAANLGLLIAGEDAAPTPFYSGRLATIDDAACTRCGECLTACRFEALTVAADGAYRVSPLSCEGCGLCAALCPADAVTFVENLAGEWRMRETPWGALIHARLGVAQGNSGKLVARLREESKKKAEAEGADLILIDGPPGVGCPVHAAIGGVDLLLVTTEPSRSGVHDMRRALELAAHFEIPACVCINKWDIRPAGFREAEEFCRSMSVPLIGRIPFDPAIPRMISALKTPLEPPAAPETVAAIEDLWTALAGELGFDSRRRSATGRL